MSFIKDQYQAELNKVKWNLFDEPFQSSYKRFAYAVDIIEFEYDEIEQLLYKVSRLNGYLEDGRSAYWQKFYFLDMFNSLFYHKPFAFSRYYYLDYFTNNNSKYGNILRVIVSSCSKKQEVCSPEVFKLISEFVIFHSAISLLHSIARSEYLDYNSQSTDWESTKEDWPFPGAFFEWDNSFFPFNKDSDCYNEDEKLLIYWANLLFPENELAKQPPIQNAGILDFVENFDDDELFNFTQERMTGKEVYEELASKFDNLKTAISKVLNLEVNTAFKSFEHFFTVIAVDPVFEEVERKNNAGYRPEFDILGYHVLDDFESDLMEELNEWMLGIFLDWDSFR